MVTAMTQGIGAMIARGLVGLGVRTFVTSRKPQAVEAIIQELRPSGSCMGAAFDLVNAGDREDFARWIEARSNCIDFLVNNAGATWGAPFESYSEAGWDRVLDLNVRSVFFLTQSLLPMLKRAAVASGRASVINIGSIDGLVPPEMDNFAYPISKAALHHLTRVLAKRFAPDGITCNAIAPGPFESKMTAHLLSDAGTRETIERKVPLGRIGSPADIVGLVAFLASPASAYITGATIPLDGGYANLH
jgi:NAD(P)-dependent dehydrogenase (short-subunit alcohol dehydrogenase family)